MKIIIVFCVFIFDVFCVWAFSQDLSHMSKLYEQKQYKELLPMVKQALKDHPGDVNLNYWYGSSLWEEYRDGVGAMPYLTTAEKGRVLDATLLLADVFASQYMFQEAESYYDKYLQGNRRNEAATTVVEQRKAYLQRLKLLISRSEDIQIIDSVLIDKTHFLEAYHLSSSMGKIQNASVISPSLSGDNSTVYINEKETKMYYALFRNGAYQLYVKEKLADQFGNERKLAPSAFGLDGDQNYPFVLSDGVTMYFAAQDSQSIGGYDLFVTRYNLDRGEYLVPERLNMPFNSPFNDYLMVIDEEKGIGWFASDRYCPVDKVCVYTFIPNRQIQLLTTDRSEYAASRAKIASIKDSWREHVDYTPLIKKAREKKEILDSEEESLFYFVINDKAIYRTFEDFKNKDAARLYEQLRHNEQNRKTKKNQLEDLRREYIQADESQKTRLSPLIFSLEQEIEESKETILQQEIEVRNIENQTIKMYSDE